MTEPAPDADQRASDDDRERVVARITLAQTEGRLDLHEYDDRLRAAWSARTYGELDRVTADLPPATRPSVARVAARPAPRGPAHGAVACWAAAGSVNLLIWAVVSVAATSWVYPWWIWVAGPWGVVLLAGRVARGWQRAATWRS